MEKESAKKREALWIPRDVMLRLKRYKAFTVPDKSLSKVGSEMILDGLKGFDDSLEVIEEAA